MIKSKRSFGVEIEFVTNSSVNYRRLMNSLPIIEDGSLRPIRNAGEVVSPILNGSSGEEWVHTACETLKKYGADCSHPATSVHIHLDGKSKENLLRSSRTLPKLQVDSGTLVFAVSNKLRNEIPKTELVNSLRNGLHLNSSGVLSVFFYNRTFNGVGNLVYYSMAPLVTKPRMNYTYYWLEADTRFNWLKNVFYFYTAFSEFTEQLVSNSRRSGNMYCIPLHESYTLDEIESAKDMNDLKHVWYKGGGSGGHYNDSRYHSVNLHCYWDRHGTVEIRSHGGTTDALKILLWLKLHQTIVDKLEDMEFSELKKLCQTDDMTATFLDFIEEPMLQEYVKRLIGFFNNKS